MNGSAKTTLIASIAGTLVLSLFATVSALIIRAEGRAYRQNHQPTPLVTADPPRASTDLSASLYIPEDHPPPLALKAVPETKAISKGPVPADPLTSRSVEPPTEEATPRPSTTRPLDPFWSLPAQTRVWDLDQLTIEGERQLGEDLHAMILHQQKVLDVGPLPRRLEETAEPLLANRTRKTLEYTFTVLDSDESNIFSHPGGYIYVTRGLFDWISEEEGYVLEFALAHEIAHVDLCHAIDCLRGPDVKSLKTPTVPIFYALVIPWGYKVEQDSEADQWATRQMIRLGRSRHDTMGFLRKLEDFARVHGFENQRKKPGDDPNLAPLDNHLRAHPIPRKRLKDQRTILDSIARPR